MKTSTSEKEFSKIKKFRIKSKDITLKTMKEKKKFKKEICKESYTCETKYDWNNDHKYIIKTNNRFVKCEYYKDNYDNYFDYNNEKIFFS